MKDTEQSRQIAERYRLAMERVAACRKQLNEIMELNRMYRMQLKNIADQYKNAQYRALNHEKSN